MRSWVAPKHACCSFSFGVHSNEMFLLSQWEGAVWGWLALGQPGGQSREKGFPGWERHPHSPSERMWAGQHEDLTLPEGSQGLQHPGPLAFHIPSAREGVSNSSHRTAALPPDGSAPSASEAARKRKARGKEDGFLLRFRKSMRWWQLHLVLAREGNGLTSQCGK